MAETMYPRRSRDLMESLSREDFETASIRSAAPSYCSEAPSTHYTVPNQSGGALPPYTAPPRTSSSAATPSGAGRQASTPAARRTVPASASSQPSSSASATSMFAISPSTSLLSSGNQRRGDMPNLSQFRIPSWSNVSTNPNARHYHSVALRRAAAAEHASAAAEIGGLMRRMAVIERLEQEEAAAAGRRVASRNNNSSAFRHLEDPYIVGETAARRTRSERIRHENLTSGDDALIREDRRWDWFLGQVKRRHTPGQVRRHFDISSLSPTTIRHIHARRM